MLAILSVVSVFVIWYFFGFIIGFVDAVTNGKSRWIPVILVALLFIFLVATFGFGYGTAIFLIIVFVGVQLMWNTAKGFITGLFALFFNRH